MSIKAWLGQLIPGANGNGAHLNGNGAQKEDPSAMVAKRSAKLSHLTSTDLHEITEDALARGDRDAIRKDAQAHRERLKARSGQSVRRQSK